jgi:hypothetical protein
MIYHTRPKLFREVAGRFGLALNQAPSHEDVWNEGCIASRVVNPDAEEMCAVVGTADKAPVPIEFGAG